MSPPTDQISRSASPAAPTRIPGGTVAGADLLRELPPDAALAVWQVLRTVLLWSAEEAHARARMFDGATMEEWEHKLLVDTFEPAARNPLAVIIGELAHPGDDTAKRISWACLCVAEWALARRAVRTGQAYTEAAALASPAEPRYAWLAGRLLRAHGNLRGAETWLARSGELAARAGDWEARSRSLVALGNLEIEYGRFPSAREFHTRALRLARRHELKELVAMACHDLFAIAIEEGQPRQAEEYARGALEAYGESYEHLPSLAHDIAYFWMSNGHFSRALEVFTAVVPHFRTPEKRFRVLANAARAAGACGEGAVFEEMWTAAQAQVPRMQLRTTLASGMVEMALGASHLGEWTRAAEALATAVSTARERSESNVLVRAESVAASVRAEQSADTVRRATRTAAAAASDALARDFVQVLSSGEWEGSDDLPQSGTP